MSETWWTVPISFVDIMNTEGTPVWPVPAGLKGTKVNAWEEDT